MHRLIEGPGSSIGKMSAQYAKDPWVDFWFGHFFTLENFNFYDFFINQLDCNLNKSIFLIWHHSMPD